MEIHDSPTGHPTRGGLLRDISNCFPYYFTP